MSEREQTSFLFGANAPFIEELYARYLDDPTPSTPSWRTFFEALASRTRRRAGRGARRVAGRPTARTSSAPSIAESLPPAANRNVQGQRRRRTGRDRRQERGQTSAPPPGHIARAHADPRLPRARPSRGQPRPAGPDAPGAASASSIRRPTASPTPTATGRSYLRLRLGLGKPRRCARSWTRLRKTYCGKIGVEFMHIQDPDQKAWIQERIERIENRTELHRRGQARRSWSG